MTTSNQSLLLQRNDGDGDRVTVLDKSTNLETFMTLFKAMSGSGLLFLPKAFSKAGFVAGICIMILSSCLTVFSNSLLVSAMIQANTDCCLEQKKKLNSTTTSSPGSSQIPLLTIAISTTIEDRSDTISDMQITTFVEVAELALGLPGRVFVKGGIVLSHLGYCAIYIGIINAVDIKGLVDSAFPSLNFIHQAYYTLLLIMSFIAVALIRKVRVVAKFSSLGNYLIFLSFGYLFYVCTVQLFHGDVSNNFDCTKAVDRALSTHYNNTNIVKTICPTINLKEFPSFFGFSVLAFIGSTFILPLREGMKEPNDFPKVMKATYLVYTIFSLIICMLPLYVWGEEALHQIIFFTLENPVEVHVLMLLYSIVFLFTTPPILLPTIKIMEEAFSLESGEGGWKQSAIRIGLICTPICFALSVGDEYLDSLVGMTGCLFCVPVQFVLPPLIYLTIMKNKLSFSDRLMSYSLVLFGIISSIISSVLLLSP